MSGHVFQGLLNALCLGRRRLFVMVRDFGSYCDEFGSEDDPRKKFMGIGGLLAWSDKWTELTAGWDDFMKKERVPYPFHMADFVHHTEDFSSPRWEDQTERMKILNPLLDIIAKAEVIPIGAVVNLKDYRGLSTEQKRKCKGPYYLAFQAVTSNIAFCAASIDLDIRKRRAKEDMEREANGVPLEGFDWCSPSSVSMVYAKRKKFTGPAESLWNAMKAVNACGYWMSSYTPGEPRDYPPLQASDIWAYTLGQIGERKEQKEEALTSFRVFYGLMKKAVYGHHGLTILDRRQILFNIGEYPD